MPIVRVQTPEGYSNEVKDSGETHEGVIKAKYGDQIPPGVEPVTVSWMPRVRSSWYICNG